VHEEDIRDLWVEVSTSALPDYGDRLIQRQRQPVATVAEQGIEDVGDSDYLALEWDLLPNQPLRVATAVIALVMSEVAVGQGDPIRIAELVAEYRDLPLGTVDASVIAAAERLDVTEVAMLDRRHFSVVRPRPRLPSSCCREWFEMRLLLGYDGRAPLDDPSTALIALTRKPRMTRQSEDIGNGMPPGYEGSSALHSTCIVLPQALPWNEKTAPRGGRFGLPEPYRYSVPSLTERSSCP
jgi:predicted nucleic acid-binding protein